jgi:hypothetical protein
MKNYLHNKSASALDYLGARTDKTMQTIGWIMHNLFNMQMDNFEFSLV